MTEPTTPEDLKPDFVDMTGWRFGILTAVRRTAGPGRRKWICACDCGGEVVARMANLRNGRHTNCGCQLAARRSAARRTHGDGTAKRRTKEYRAWIHIRGRCERPTDAAWADYGGRGIKVCERWSESYEVFLADMGRAPSSLHSIDRKDNDGDYEPDNCRWATPTEQARNTRRAIRLGDRPLRDVAEERGIPWPRVEQRLRRGATPEDAVSALEGNAYRRKT